MSSKPTDTAEIDARLHRLDVAHADHAANFSRGHRFNFNDLDERNQLELAKAIKAMIAVGLHDHENSKQAFKSEFLPKLQRGIDGLLALLQEHGERLPHSTVSEIIQGLYSLSQTGLNKEYESLVSRIQKLEKFQRGQLDIAAAYARTRRPR